MRRAVCDCPQRRRFDGKPKARRKPDRAQGTQAILAHALVGVANSAYHATLEVALSLERVTHLAGAW